MMFLEGSMAREGALLKKMAVAKSMHQFKGPVKNLIYLPAFASSN